MNCHISKILDYYLYKTFCFLSIHYVLKSQTLFKWFFSPPYLIADVMVLVSLKLQNKEVMLASW